jgi:cytochrome b pre-mRNA-processing protein 3
LDFSSTLRRFLGLRANQRPAERAYHALVAFARNPGLYREFFVPDTFDARFDALAFHVAIFLTALRLAAKDSAEARAFAREVTEVFLDDMDRALREAGRGDLAVGKEVKRMASALFGRLRAYGEALAEPGDRALADAVRRNLFRGQPPSAAAVANLAKYARLSYIQLTKKPAGELMAGRFDPNPFPVRP